MDDTMRDLLSKLDAIVSETSLNPNNPKGDYEAKRKALDDLERDGKTDKSAIQQRRLDLDKEAESKGIKEADLDFDKIRKDAADHIKKSIDKQSDDRIAKLKQDREDSKKSFLQKVGDKQIGMIKGAIKGFRGKEDINRSMFEVGDDFGISFSEDLEIATEIVGFVEDGIVIDLDEKALEMLEAQGVLFLEGELAEGLRDPKDNPCWKGYKPVGTKKKNGKTVPNCVPKESIEEDHGPEDPDADYNVGEYDREGDMAKDQLRTVNDAAKELYSIIAADENLPEWVQAKITKAMDYLDTARDYMKANKYAEDCDMDEAKYQGKEVPLGKKLPGDVKKSKVYVRKPNGKVVKVNFGDKKMRIKKSNPARRKSFRARHNCKNPGPRWKARYWSCRSW